MTALTTSAPRWRLAFGRPAGLRVLATGSILVLIGIELAVFATVLPDTVQQWWTADSTGDFGNFYTDAKNLDINGLYSPGLSLLMFPLSWLSLAAAYRVYVALGAVALLAVAYLAQRQIDAPEGRIAMVLGVLSIPQMHWALRLGHMTSFLALAALGGFLLVRKRPILAGLCFAVLILKPQYAPIPALYLLWTRNGRALGAMAAGALAISVAGFAAVGFGELGSYLGSFLDLSADTRDNLLPYQQSWQYAWQGVLMSAEIEPNPLVALDLSLLSLGVVIVAWSRGTRAAALTAAALGMLIVTPYANFYDWGLIVVAAALLLQTDLRWPVLAPAVLVGLYAALLYSQSVTPFPAVDVRVGVIQPDGSVSILPASQVFPADGIYWITPLALASVALLAVAGRRRASVDDAEMNDDAAPSDGERERSLKPAMWLGLAAVVIPVAYFASAFYGDAPPFTKEYDPFAPSEVRKQVPDDFALPDDAKLRIAGKGSGDLPFHLEWTTDASVPEIASLYDDLLESESWELSLAEGRAPSYRVRLMRNELGFMTHFVIVDASPAEDGSLISLDLWALELHSLTSAANASGS